MSTEEWKKNNKDRLRKSRRDWYHRNKESEKRRIKKRKKEIIKWFAEYKSKLVCEICEEDHPACLEFHHINRSTKDIDVSRAVRNGWSIKSILEEIDKCIVLCANCHRKEHYED